MKTRRIIFIVLILGLVGFAWVQKNRAEQQLIDALAARNIVVQPENIGFTLSPFALTAKNIRYPLLEGWMADIPYTELQLSFFSLFSGDPKVEYLRLNGATLSSKKRIEFAEFKRIDFTLKPTALSLSDLKAGDFSQKPFHLDLAFVRNDKAPSRLMLRNALLLEAGQGRYQLSVPNMMINKASFNQVKMQIFSDGTLYFRSAQGDVDFYTKPSAYQLVGKNIEIGAVFSALDINSIMRARGDIQGLIQFGQDELSSGKLNFQVGKGKLIGMNVLAMVSQHLPLNYDERRLQQTEMDSDFDTAAGEIVWDETELFVEKIEMQMPMLKLSGSGKMSFVTQQCDFLTTLSPTETKYQKLAVPLRFFGDCYSPQYKVELDREFQRGVRDLLKERFR